jgi:hypothetical protein
MRKLLHSVPVESRKVPPELIRVIERICPDPFSAVLETFVAERSSSARAFARQLLEHFGAQHVETLQERFAAVSGTVACDLLRAIANIDVERSASFIAQQAWHSDPEVQDEALRHLDRIPYSGALGRSLFEAVRRVDPVRRLKIFKLILRSKDQRFVDRMARHIEEQGDRLPPGDAEQLGRVMGRLGGYPSLPLWQSWLIPTGWLRKTLQGPLACQVAAAAAVGEIPGEEAGEVLREAVEASGGQSQEWINRARARHEAAAAKRSAS